MLQQEKKHIWEFTISKLGLTTLQMQITAYVHPAVMLLNVFNATTFFSQVFNA